MEGDAPLSKEDLNILCLLKKNTLISVGFLCQVNYSLDPELDVPVIKCLGFLTVDAIKSRATLWIWFCLRYMSKGLRNFHFSGSCIDSSPSNYFCEQMRVPFFFKQPKL